MPFFESLNITCKECNEVKTLEKTREGDNLFLREEIELS